MSCPICGDWRSPTTCADCARVAALIPTLSYPLFCIVDGGWHHQWSGAGLVLVADHLRGDFVAFCACRFDARSSSEAEIEAVRRGRLWAPGVQVFTDSFTAIRQTATKDFRACFIDPICREPNHSYAHRLSRQGRLELRAAERKAAGR